MHAAFYPFRAAIILPKPRDRRHRATPHPRSLPFGRGEGVAAAALGRQGERLRRGLPQGLSVSICGFIVSTAGFRIMGIAALLTLAMPLPQRIEHTSVVPPLYVRSTSVPPPSVIQRYYGGTSDVQRRYYGGTKHVVTAVGGQQFSL